MIFYLYWEMLFLEHLALLETWHSRLYRTRVLVSTFKREKTKKLLESSSFLYFTSKMTKITWPYGNLSLADDLTMDNTSWVNNFEQKFKNFKPCWIRSCSVSFLSSDGSLLAIKHQEHHNLPLYINSRVLKID